MNFCHNSFWVVLLGVAYFAFVVRVTWLQYQNFTMNIQKGKETKKKKKKMSKTDTLPAERKNKKEMEFELKLAKEKEEILEREKQMKISRLLQEVQLCSVIMCGLPIDWLCFGRVL